MNSNYYKNCRPTSLPFVGMLFWIAIALGGCSDKSLEQLPHFRNIAAKSDYKVEPYIRAAVTLQAMGRERACQQMMAVAIHDEDAEQIHILCRMLFTNRGNSDFREPWIGGYTFLGGTVEDQWPLKPIELVDGVPFIITWGITIHGVPESPDEYLRYCMTNCDWNTFKYQLKSQNELENVLNKLLASSKWKRPFEQQGKDILSKQIK